MAHYEHVKTFTYNASAAVPYRYVCGKCGKENTGKAVISAKKEISYRSRHEENLKIGDNEAKMAESDAISEVTARLKIYRKQVQKGNYEILKPYRKCRHCSANQKWGYSLPKAIIFILIAAAAAAAGIFSLNLYLGVLENEETDATFLLCTVFAFLWAAVFGYAGIKEAAGKLSSKSQQASKPEVYFDRMPEEWTQRLK